MRNRGDFSPEERRTLSRLRQLLVTPGLMRGNLVQMKRKCGKPNCRCADGKQLHVSWYISQSREGKPRMLYIPADWEERVTGRVTKYQEVRKLLEQLSEIYWKELKQRGR